MNENTNFQIASNSKVFTTAALAILEDEGKLKWTDKVKDHIPGFKMYDDYVTENFKMKGISPSIDFSFDFHDIDLKRIEN